MKWVESTGADRYRRGLYIHFQRTTPYPQLMNFDAPSANLSCTRRERTDTPLQALNLMNDPVFFEAAQGLAFRVMRESDGAFRDRLNYAYAVTLGRTPSAREAERMGKYFDETLHGLQQTAGDRRGAVSEPHRGRAAAGGRGVGGVEPRAAQPGRIHHEGMKSWTAKSSAKFRPAAASFEQCAGGIGIAALAQLMEREGRGARPT